MLRRSGRHRLSSILSTTESKYIEKTDCLSGLGPCGQLEFREGQGQLEAESGREAVWLRGLREDGPEGIPLLVEVLREARRGLKRGARRVNGSRALKHDFNEVMSGLTRARQAFVATKESAP